jgi:MoxR-like ATPase
LTQAWPPEVGASIRQLDELVARIDEQLIDRTHAIRLLALALLCREHILAIGPPGVAKTLIATCFSQGVRARRFEMQLTRFSEPSELFGPLDIDKFREGVYAIRTDGMLADVEIGFLDEVFEANSAVLNSLLTLMNERAYHNGKARQAAPLLTLIGCSNAVPDDASLAAFSDRFLLRMKLEPVPDERLRDLLRVGWKGERANIIDADDAIPLITVEKLRDLHRRLAEIDLNPILPQYEELVLRLRRDDVAFSDRRAVRALKLIAGAALMREAAVAAPRDFWPINSMWVRDDDRPALEAAVTWAMGQEAPTEQDNDRLSHEELAARLDAGRRDVAAAGSEVALFQLLRELGTLRRAIMRIASASPAGADDEGSRQIRQLQESVGAVISEAYAKLEDLENDV